MIWLAGRRMKSCRACGDVFAFKRHSECYCSDPACQAAKTRTRKKRKGVVRSLTRDTRLPTGVRAALLDADAALQELRAWMAVARAKC